MQKLDLSEHENTIKELIDSFRKICDYTKPQMKLAAEIVQYLKIAFIMKSIRDYRN